MLFDSPKRRVEKYLRQHPEAKTILVTGSYGRSSALRALGEVLGQTLSVSFGVNLALSPDVVLLDHRSFGIFPDIRPDFAVITSCLDEEAAKTFFALANRAHYVFVGTSDVPQAYAEYLTNSKITTYGDALPANYYFEEEGFDLDGHVGNIVTPDSRRLHAHLHMLGEHNLRAIIMATGIAEQFALSPEDIIAGIEKIRPLRGRMSPAKGLRGSIIIDDSANTSIMSVRYGLNAICRLSASARYLVTDDASKLQNFNLEPLSKVLILGKPPKNTQNHPKIHYFNTDLDLMQYLGARLDESALVLLEIPLPEIIESYQW